MVKLGIYLGKMTFNLEEGRFIQTYEAELNQNLKEYNVDRTAIVPKLDCDYCDEYRKRDTCYFGLMPDRTLVTLGSSCAEKLLGRKCLVCGTNSISVMKKNGYCRHCNTEKVEICGKRMSLNAFKKKIKEPTNEGRFYRDYGVAIVCADTDSRIRRRMLYSGHYRQPLPDEICPLFYTTGFFTNCSVYHVYIMCCRVDFITTKFIGMEGIDVGGTISYNIKDNGNDLSIEKIISKTCDKCILCRHQVRPRCYTFRPERIYRNMADKAIKYSKCGYCDTCADIKSNVLNYGIYRGNTYEQVSRDLNYMSLCANYGNGPFSDFCRILIYDALPRDDDIINRTCIVCHEFIEHEFHKRNVCCDFNHTRQDYINAEIIELARSIMNCGIYKGQSYGYICNEKPEYVNLHINHGSPLHPFTLFCERIGSLYTPNLQPIELINRKCLVCKMYTEQSLHASGYCLDNHTEDELHKVNYAHTNGMKIITFGIHNGNTFRHVFDNYPEYINLYCHYGNPVLDFTQFARVLGIDKCDYDSDIADQKCIVCDKFIEYGFHEHDKCCDFGHTVQQYHDSQRWVNIGNTIINRGKYKKYNMTIKHFVSQCYGDSPVLQKLVKHYIDKLRECALHDLYHNIIIYHDRFCERCSS